MNIFLLDTYIEKSLQYHCDKHVVKMVLEYAQILSTCHHELDGISSSILNEIYKPTQKNHPSVVWARAHESHYDTLYEMFRLSLQEYTHRYGKTHKTGQLLELLKSPPHRICTEGKVYKVGTTKFHTLPPQSMTEECRKTPSSPTDLDSVIEAYRKYYLIEKKHLLAYRNRNFPKWAMP